MENVVLKMDPEEWVGKEGFASRKKALEAYPIVNDYTKRAVKLAEDFTSCITNQEEQKQFLLRTVIVHRKDYPDTKKV